MIESFRHKGLLRLFRDDDAGGVNPEHVRRLRHILGILAEADNLAQIGAFPTFNLHPLKGDRKGQWAMTVRANWRVTFRFEGGKAFDVNLEDYH